MGVVDHLDIPDAEPEREVFTTSDGTKWEIAKKTFVSTGTGGDFGNTPGEIELEEDVSEEYMLLRNGKTVKRLSAVRTRPYGYKFIGEKDGYLYIRDKEFDKNLRVNLKKD